MHLTKKKRKEKTRKNCQDGRINTQSDPTDLFKTKRRKKKYAAACPTRLCSSLWIVNSKQIIQKGNKLPKLDFLEVWSFFGGYIKVLQCAIFCKLNKPPLHSSTDEKIARKNLQKKSDRMNVMEKNIIFPRFFVLFVFNNFYVHVFAYLTLIIIWKKVTLNNYLGRFC